MNSTPLSVNPCIMQTSSLEKMSNTKMFLVWLCYSIHLCSLLLINVLMYLLQNTLECKMKNEKLLSLWNLYGFEIHFKMFQVSIIMNAIVL